MKITAIVVRRVKNLGNYETETLEMSAEIDELEDPEAAVDNLRQRVFFILNSPPMWGKPSEDPDFEPSEGF